MTRQERLAKALAEGAGPIAGSGPGHPPSGGTGVMRPPPTHQVVLTPTDPHALLRQARRLIQRELQKGEKGVVRGLSEALDIIVALLGE